MASLSVNMHWVDSVKIVKSKLRPTSDYEVIRITVRDRDGDETDFTLFGSDHKPIMVRQEGVKAKLIKQ